MKKLSKIGDWLKLGGCPIAFSTIEVCIKEIIGEERREGWGCGGRGGGLSNKFAILQVFTSMDFQSYLFSEEKPV